MKFSKLAKLFENIRDLPETCWSISLMRKRQHDIANWRGCISQEIYGKSRCKVEWAGFGFGMSHVCFKLFPFYKLMPSW